MHISVKSGKDEKLTDDISCDLEFLPDTDFMEI